MIVTQGSQHLAFGLHWDALSQLGDAMDQARRIAREESATRFCVVHSRDGKVEPVVGLLVGGSKAKKGHRLEAAAAAFATATDERAALYIGATDDPHRFVLVGLLSGLPSPSYDLVGTADEVKAKAEEFQEHLTEGAPLYVQTEAASSSPFQATMAAFLRRNGAVLRVVPEMPSASTLGNERGGEMLGVGSSKGLVYGGVAMVVAAILSGAAWLFLDWESRNNQEAKAKLAQEAAFQAFKTSQETAFSSVSTARAVPAAEATWQYVRDAQLKRAGWALSSILCASGSCEATFSRGLGSTFAGLKKTVTSPEAEKIALASLESATVVAPIKNWSAVPVLDLQQVDVSAADMVVPLGSEAQFMQTAGLSVAVTDPANLGDFAQAAASRRPVRRYKVGTWSISGPADTFEAAMKRLPKTSTLTSVKFTPTPEGVSYAADGRFFVLEAQK